MKHILTSVVFLLLSFTHQFVYASEKQPPAVKIQKKAKYQKTNTNLYTSVELRHHLNVYYDNENYLRERSPSVQATTTNWSSVL